MRTFISIDIPELVREEIVKIQGKLPEFKGRVTEPENLHLTLKFLGEIDEETLTEVKERLKEIKFDSFETEIDEVGVFENRTIIVWLHLTNCDSLQKKVDEALNGLFEKERRFMSHLTIARVKDVKDKKKFLDEVSKMKVSGIKFNVDNFRIKESVLTSRGPAYKTLEEYSLEQ